MRNSITIQDAALRLNTTTSVVCELIKDNELYAYRGSEDELRILVSDVADYMRDHLLKEAPLSELVPYKPCVVNDLRDEIDCKLRDQFGYGHLSLETYRLDAWHMFQSRRSEEDAYTPYNEGDLKWHLSTLKEKLRMA